MFGEDAVRRSATGCSLAIGLSQFDMVTPAELAHEFGDAAPAGDGRDEYMAALTIRTRSLDARGRGIGDGADQRRATRAAIASSCRRPRHSA